MEAASRSASSGDDSNIRLSKRHKRHDAAARKRADSPARKADRGALWRRAPGPPGHVHACIMSARNARELRRDRDRRRPQRPRERGLPGARRQEGAGARAPARAGRRRRHRRGVPGLPLLGLLLRRLAAAARDHPRARPAAPRPRDPAARRHLHADAERRPPVAHERPRQDAARDLPPLAHGRRGLRRVREGDGRDGALRQADPLDGAAGPLLVRRARPRAARRARPALPEAPARASSTACCSS